MPSAMIREKESQQLCLLLPEWTMTRVQLFNPLILQRKKLKLTYLPVAEQIQNFVP
jgi:hypothetical protein